MAEQLKCHICLDAVNGVDGLRRHMTYGHGITLSKHRGFVCGVTGCEIEFELFSSLRRHILNHHQDVPRQNNVQDVQGQHNSDSSDISEIDDDYEAVLDEFNDEEEFLENSLIENEAPETALSPNLSQLATNTILNLRSKSSVTGSVVSEVMQSLSDSFEVLKNNLEMKISQVLEHYAVGPETSAAVSGSFNVPNPFRNLKSLSQQVAYLEQHSAYIKPLRVHLSDRVDVVRDRKTGCYGPKLVKNDCYYVPILEVIKLVLSVKHIRQAIMSEMDAQDGYLKKFRDGNHFKAHPLFSRNQCAIQLQMSYDDVVVNNRIGPKTAIHKLGAFYWSILNLPTHLNSKLGAIFLLMLCYTIDIKKYGFKVVLKRFLQDLNILEQGVVMRFDGEEYFVIGTIASVCADGLAAHEIFGLLSPSCRSFCRFGDIQRADLLAGNSRVGVIRTAEVYEAELDRLRAGHFSPNLQTETGIREECALHESRYFRFPNNWVFDPMHDFPEGVDPYELKLVIKYYVREAGYFDVKSLNSRINSFNYGLLEIKNKPSGNLTMESIRDDKDHSLKQNAKQMMCLLRVFPFLVSDWIPVGDKHMRLITLLLSIHDIVFAPVIHKGSLGLLEMLICEHHELFKELFPTANMINKHHHICHYPQCIREMGPAVVHWCMRYEGKHNPLSRHGAVVCNFKNLPKTLSRMCQIDQCKFWTMKESAVWVDMKYAGGRTYSVSDLFCGAELVECFFLNPSDEVIVPTSVKVCGSLFCSDLFVVLKTGVDTEDNYPVFAQIEEVFIIHKFSVVLSVIVWSCICHERSLHAFRVERPILPEKKLVLTTDLAYHRCVDVWRCFRNNAFYISPRTAFF